jgi:protease II
MPCRFEDHPTVSVTSVHSLVAIARNGWSRSIGTPGRNQLERAVAITRCAQLTPGEWSEWGNPIEDKAAFDFIRSYSPYDNVTAQDYPPMLVTAGLSDPRVTYWEPAKWVAKLRATKTDRNLLLLKTNMGAGHGGKSGRYVSLEEAAEEYAFLLTRVPGL